METLLGNYDLSQIKSLLKSRGGTVIAQPQKFEDGIDVMRCVTLVGSQEGINTFARILNKEVQREGDSRVKIPRSFCSDNLELENYSFSQEEATKPLTCSITISDEEWAGITSQINLSTAN